MLLFYICLSVGLSVYLVCVCVYRVCVAFVCAPSELDNESYGFRVVIGVNNDVFWVKSAIVM